MEVNNGNTSDLIIQYSVVGLVLLAACGWIIYKLFKKNKEKSNSCCGCSIADSCSKKQKNKK